MIRALPHFAESTFLSFLFCALLVALLAFGSAATSARYEAGAAASDESDEAAPRWYTFGWPVGNDPERTPRGGTTTGVSVTPDPDAAAPWRALQEDGLTSKERDRAAIRALAGEFRTSFDFIETLTYVPGLERARPYQSWATEYVFVIEDRADFISLQHILVMSFVEDDGSIRGPFVQKHWRQDWRFEAERALQFEGDRRWVVRPVTPAPGSWTQTVHQVDDTPRYSATGRWQHEGGYSVWEADRAWRPLPRREHTVRDDYQVMSSRHRVSITPQGWIHEQDNLKAVLDETGALHGERPYLAREQGLSRYARISGHDFDAGREYWQQTAEYWTLVREWWQARLARDGRFILRSSVDGRPLFMPLFEGAERLRDADADRDPAALRQYVEETLDRYIGSNDPS